jgi:hypothetical protein
MLNQGAFDIGRELMLTKFADDRRAALIKLAVRLVRVRRGAAAGAKRTAGRNVAQLIRADQPSAGTRSTVHRRQRAEAAQKPSAATMHQTGDDAPFPGVAEWLGDAARGGLGFIDPSLAKWNISNRALGASLLGAGAGLGLKRYFENDEPQPMLTRGYIPPNLNRFI